MRFDMIKSIQFSMYFRFTFLLIKLEHMMRC